MSEKIAENNNIITSEQNIQIGKKNFGFYLALVTSFLIAFAIITTVFYSTRCINLLVKDYTVAANSYDDFISTSIVKAFTNDIERNQYKDSIDLINRLKQNKYVKYTYAYRSEDNNIFWASEPELFGQNKRNGS